MKLPEKLYVAENCPREGWQKYKCFIPTESKIRIIKSMVDYGAKDIELGIFSASPKLNWQFTDLPEVAEAMRDYTQDKNVALSAQVDDYDTCLQARDAGFEYLHFFVSASEKFGDVIAGKTYMYSIHELEKAMGLGLNVSIGFGAALGCPFGGEVTDEHVLELIRIVDGLGVQRVSLADSGGLCAPAHLYDLLIKVGEHYDINKVGVHLHQTRGMGLANAVTALQLGVNHIDGALGAMGGCPFIPGAKGNIATEDLVNMCVSMGMKCDIDLDKAIDASLTMCELIDAPIISSMAGIRHSAAANK
ncbi:MAG TPA: hypothetical protein IAB47_01340 [Candidatus Scatomorpha merdigallinarum]|nr:hypothetical protein [Candidatus Scatomorpha merdigallinarum]